MTMKNRILKRLGHFTISLILMSLVLPLTHAQSEPFYMPKDSEVIQIFRQLAGAGPMPWR